MPSSRLRWGPLVWVAVAGAGRPVNPQGWRRSKQANAPFRSRCAIVRSTPRAPMRRWPYILVVDDDADFRMGLRTALEMKGYQVDEAAQGEEALLKLLEKAQVLEATIANLLRPRLVTSRPTPEKPVEKLRS